MRREKKRGEEGSGGEGKGEEGREKKRRKERRGEYRATIILAHRKRQNGEQPTSAFCDLAPLP